jgi:membrane-associated phospholipid phosphatase
MPSPDHIPPPSGAAPDGRMPTTTWRVAAVSLGLFVGLTAVVSRHDQPYLSFDLSVSQSVQAHAGPGSLALMRGISLAGDNALWSSLLVAVVVLVPIALGAWREAGFLVGVVVVGQILKIAVKQLVARPRPSPDLVEVLIHAQEVHSYPSGHTVHYVVFFGFLWFLTYRYVQPAPLRWLLLAVCDGLILLVGLARIALGAHWVSDVVAGYLLGAAVLAAGVGLYESGALSRGGRDASGHH